MVRGEVSERVAMSRSFPLGRRPERQDRRRKGRAQEYSGDRPSPIATVAAKPSWSCHFARKVASGGLTPFVASGDLTPFVASGDLTPFVALPARRRNVVLHALLRAANLGDEVLE